MSETKTCSKCGELKAVELFRAGYRGCKLCAAIAQKKWVAANPEKTKARAKRYYKKNVAKEQQRNRERYEATKSAIKARRLKLGDDYNIEHRAAVSKYAKANKSKLNARAAAYRSANGEQLKARVKAYRRTMPDSYLRAIIHQSVGIPANAVPSYLIEVKRKHLQILRTIKEKTK